MGLVKVKSDDEFCWGAEQQQALDEVKEYLSKPAVLVPPQNDRPFYVYLSVGDTSIAWCWSRSMTARRGWFSTSADAC